MSGLTCADRDGHGRSASPTEAAAEGSREVAHLPGAIGSDPPGPGRNGRCVVVSHPTGNANVRGVLRAAAGSQVLHGFWTTIALPPRLAALSIIGERTRRQLARRSFPEAPWESTVTRPLREMVRQASRAAGLGALSRHEVGWASFDGVYRQLDRDVAAFLRHRGSREVRAVYAYEDAARETFVAARARGVTCIYDLPIAHWRTLHRLLEEEAELNPAWAPTMEGITDSAQKRQRKDDEIGLAERVVVASSFTRQSLEAHFGAELPIVVTPYGSPAPMVDRPAERAHGEPLRLLYAGHLSQRKGLAYLIAALARLEVPWRLTLAGPRPAVAPAELDAFLGDPRCTWLGAVPHRTLLEAMTQAHVFVFPSIVEGFGLVLTEAMAAGLPLVTTPHTGAPDIITDGEEGFILPIRDVDAIAATLTRLHEEEMLRRQMATAALANAARSGWETYEARIATLLEEALPR